MSVRTYGELKERLKRLGEIDLLEVLQIDSEQLVERFDDIIEQRAEYLAEEVDWEDDDNLSL